ncbi:F-box only protein 7 [Picochlorum sp. SENEW3]|nr:F-box only protein 7 [Picochlorum sp. SENEW3]WPT17387.1 F-box only protein 7 [Picochlorum sp. SENEW3]
MKIRVRFPKKKKATAPADSGKEKSTVVLHVEHSGSQGNDNLTIGDLKRSICCHVGSDETEAWKGVSVSLNGTTPLSSSDQGIDDDKTSLKSVGVCSGDLIWVLEMPVAEGCADVNMDEEIPSGRAGLVPLQIGIVDRTLYDARDYVLQHHLQLLRSDAVALVIHAAMLACGFDSNICFGDVVGPCRMTCSAHQIRYNVNIENNGEIDGSWEDVCEMSVSNLPGGGCVACAHVGKRMDGHDRCTVVHTFRAVPCLDDFFRTHSYSFHDDLREFWNVCKDELCLPLLYKSIQSLGLNYSPRASLVMMPSGVKQQILTKLDYKDLCALSMTCREMSYAGSDDAVWLQLLERYFPGRHLQESSASTTQGYVKSIFKTAMIASMERKRDRRHVSRLQQPMPPGPSYPPFPGSRRPQYPGIIGGDYDRLPGVPFGQPHGLPGRGFGPAGFSSSFGGRRSQNWRLG